MTQESCRRDGSEGVRPRHFALPNVGHMDGDGDSLISGRIFSGESGGNTCVLECSWLRFIRPDRTPRWRWNAISNSSSTWTGSGSTKCG
jgi:hypothetical protein